MTGVFIRRGKETQTHKVIVKPETKLLPIVSQGMASIASKSRARGKEEFFSTDERKQSPADTLILDF